MPLTADEARRRLAAQKRNPRKRRYAHMINRERGEVNWRIIRECSTPAEAVERTGLTEAGVQVSLYKHTGSRRWCGPYA